MTPFYELCNLLTKTLTFCILCIQIFIFHFQVSGFSFEFFPAHGTVWLDDPVFDGGVFELITLPRRVARYVLHPSHRFLLLSRGQDTDRIVLLLVSII